MKARPGSDDGAERERVCEHIRVASARGPQSRLNRCSWTAPSRVRPAIEGHRALELQQFRFQARRFRLQHADLTTQARDQIDFSWNGGPWGDRGDVNVFRSRRL